MKKQKVNNKDFIRAISKETGFTQKDIADVLESAADLVISNLSNGIETAVFQGMVIYPATYNNEVTFPRARFGKFFKTFSSNS